MEETAREKISYSNQALALISASKLPHPDNQIVKAYVADAVDPDLAAQYLLKTLGAFPELGDGESKDLELYQFLTDWKTLSAQFRPTACDNVPRATKALLRARDGARCCFTGLRAWFFGRRRLICTCIVPPSAFTCTNTAPFEYLNDMLDAFITPAKRRWACSLFEHAGSADCTQLQDPVHRVDNLWLLSPNAYSAFAEGGIQLHPDGHPWDGFPLPEADFTDPGLKTTTKAVDTSLQQSYSVRYAGRWSIFATVWGWYSPNHVTLKNRSPGLLPLPAPELFEIHARFANALAWKAVGEQMQHGWPAADKSMTWLSVRMQRFLKHAWLRLPQSVRVKTYVFLKRIGNYVYGSNTVMPGAVTRLPFNLYLKFGCFGVQEGVSRGTDAAHGNQARAMHLLERHTQVPAPRTIDWICDAKRSFLIMTRAPGVPLGSVMYRMSDAEIVQLVEDLRRCLWQMRSIPNPYGPQSTICSAHGQGCFDFRINNSTRQEYVKFKSEVEFNDYLLSDVPENEHAKAMPVLSTPHRICFTHGDLNARNILIDRGRLSGIVDWENAGWFPEYWEYTKIHYINRWTNRYLDDVVEKLFPDYTKERENEYFLWQWVRPFG